LTIAFQITIFYFADSIAQAGTPVLSTIADIVLALFYAGVAATATLCFYWKPDIEIVNNRSITELKHNIVYRHS